MKIVRSLKKELNCKKLKTRHRKENKVHFIINTMSRLLSSLEIPVDKALGIVNESLRAVTHEAWQFSSQIANGWSALALGYVHLKLLFHQLYHSSTNHTSTKFPLQTSCTTILGKQKPDPLNQKHRSQSAFWPLTFCISIKT
jgi:hypothetical protein